MPVAESGGDGLIEHALGQEFVHAARHVLTAADGDGVEYPALQLHGVAPVRRAGRLLLAGEHEGDEVSRSSAAPQLHLEQRALYRVHQFPRQEGLKQVFLNLQPYRLLGTAKVVVAAYYNECGRIGHLAAAALNDLYAAEFRHVDVEDSDIRLASLYHLQGLCPITGCSDQLQPVALPVYILNDGVAGIRLVVREQDLYHC